MRYGVSIIDIEYERRHGVSGYAADVDNTADRELIPAVPGKRLLIKDIHIHNKATVEVHFTFRNAKEGKKLAVIAVAADGDVLLSYRQGISCGKGMGFFVRSDNPTPSDVDVHGIQK